MIEMREPRFQWGQPVIARGDLINDGSFPGRDADARLVAGGEAGEIVNVGVHHESGIPVYLVQFLAGVIGCLEEELAPRSAAPRPAGREGQ